MLKSMTAYGRAVVNTPQGHFVIEIHSVNRKFLDVNVSIPQELSQFEIELKKWVLPYLTRGQITIKVNAAFENTVPFVIQPNLPLARQLKEAWIKIGHELYLDGSQFSLHLLKDQEGLIRFEENHAQEDAYRQILKETLEEALKGFIEMKNQEGLLLQADLTARLEKIRHSMQLVEHKAPYATQRYREKLLSRLEEVLPGHVENEERVLREIALFAEKIDIAEEITRFYCHLTHFEELMQSTAHGLGKTLEFVLHELGREINTVGNKSSDLEVARAVIDIKSELERIREQIQNIE
jgi:uncharacterized protein (TIGR00255 family)